MVFKDPALGIQPARSFSSESSRTYNNSLVEVYLDERGNLHRNIYMPTYGVDVIERVIEKQISELGYRLIWVKGLEQTQEFAGSLRCITSELRSKFDLRE